MPTASTISIVETLDLLDGPQKNFFDGFQAAQYALWLGSGISRERVVGLDGVLSKLLENLRLRITGTDCVHHCAFDAILGLADLSDTEKAQVDLAQPVRSWPIHDALIDRLWNKYSKVLGIEVQGRPFDHLLWDVLEFAATFAAQKPDAEHLAVGMLVLEGVVSDLATANWDGLLEEAMVELGGRTRHFVSLLLGATCTDRRVSGLCTSSMAAPSERSRTRPNIGHCSWRGKQPLHIGRRTSASRRCGISSGHSLLDLELW